MLVWSFVHTSTSSPCDSTPSVVVHRMDTHDVSRQDGRLWTCWPKSSEPNSGLSPSSRCQSQRTLLTHLHRPPEIVTPLGYLKETSARCVIIDVAWSYLLSFMLFHKHMPYRHLSSNQKSHYDSYNILMSWLHRQKLIICAVCLQVHTFCIQVMYPGGVQRGGRHLQMSGPCNRLS